MIRKTDYNVVSGSSQGLHNDAVILSSALKRVLASDDARIRCFSGADSKIKTICKLINLVAAKYLVRRIQITFFLEKIFPEFLLFSDTHILIPNQEWLRPDTVKAITPHSLIWCKTKYALRQLQHLNNNVSYLGFTSRDLNDSSIDPDFDKYLHIAGQSGQKGTVSLMKTWAKHPEWPVLTVISRNKDHKSITAPNIIFISSFLSEKRIKELINKHGVHICPSESEGFGHSIVEAMAVGAIVMTTNAPPMNELVSQEDQCLFQYRKKSKRHYGEIFYVDECSIEKKMTSIFLLDHERKKEISLRNIETFKSFTNEFMTRMDEKINLL